MRRVIDLLHAVRFRLWTARLRAELRRKGGRLIVDAPHGARLRGFPRLEVLAAGDGDATLRLRIGRNVQFGHGVHLRIEARGTNVLDLADGVVLQDGARLWLFSGSVTLGKGTILRDLAALKSSGDLRLGAYVRFGYASHIHCHERVQIDDRVGMADHITIIDSDHVHDGSDTWMMRQPVLPGPVHVGANTLVGANVVLTRGARLGRNSVVAAGAVVREGEYPDGWVVGGVPARPLRALAETAAVP